MRRRLAFSAEIIFIGTLILVTRCANYGDVFFGGQINFVDADCYARMTRARICFEHPGTIVRRHDFENFPTGTYPHTTAPLDYLIVAIATALTPLTNYPLDLAGAVVSPLLSIVLGIFLCWWSRKMQLRFRWGLLILYAVSPILAHGFALGRPDHQSLVIALTTVALCAEWTLAKLPSKSWSIISGASWATALWVSLYEPMVLLAIVLVFRSRVIFIRERQSGWIVFVAILAIAFGVERRIPHWPDPEFAGALINWSGSIGEMSHVSLRNPIWFGWSGGLLLFAPILFWRAQDHATPYFLRALLIATFALTIWQARWAYFFVMVFATTLPELLMMLRKPTLAAAVFIIALFPIARSWDRTLELAPYTENEVEMIDARAIASHLDGAFLAPWWFCPALSYWSRQPGVAGSSHESIEGVMQTARCFGTQDTEEAAQILKEHSVKWIITYDADRVAQNSAELLKHPVFPNAVCYVLDRRPSEAPPFLRLMAQIGCFKLFRVLDPRKM